MLFSKLLNDPDAHAQTLIDFASWEGIETFDCCLPYGAERQAPVIDAIRSSGKTDITFATHLFPLRKLSLATTLPHEQHQVRVLMTELIDQAVSIGATGFIFASGGPDYASGTRTDHLAFEEFCYWLCEKLQPHGITAQLEPFDFNFDKSFLYGPLDHCLTLVDKVTRTHPNLGIELDVAHLPLMGEDMVSAINRSAPFLERVHLGNCVCKDLTDPFYGDNHPPIGYPGGEISDPELITILAALKDARFLAQESRGCLVIELNPFPGWSEFDSAMDNLKRVHSAWESV